MPKALCPLCWAEREDSNDKILFQIDSFDKWRLHKDVPKEYFDFPPSRLEDDDPSMQALRVGFFTSSRKQSLMILVPIRVYPAIRVADKAQAQQMDES